MGGFARSALYVTKKTVYILLPHCGVYERKNICPEIKFLLDCMNGQESEE